MEENKSLEQEILPVEPTKFGEKLTDFWKRFRKPIVIIVGSFLTLVILLFLGAKAVNASYPGSFFYGLEQAVENLERGFLSSPEAELEYEHERLSEREQELEDAEDSGDSDRIKASLEEVLKQAEVVLHLNGEDLASLNEQIARLERMKSLATTEAEEKMFEAIIDELKDERELMDDYDEDEESHIVNPNSQISEDDARGIALAEISGTVREVEQEYEEGVLVWSIKIIDAEGREREVKVDAETGQIVEIEGSSDSQGDEDENEDYDDSSHGSSEDLYEDESEYEDTEDDEGEQYEQEDEEKEDDDEEEEDEEEDEDSEEEDEEDD